MAKVRYKNRLKVLFVTSELTPIAKAGGLGDVVGQLPKELAREFHIEIRIVMPKYKCIDTAKYPSELIIKDRKFELPNKKWHTASVWKTFIPETIVPIYLIDAPKVFLGDDVYNHNLQGRNQTYPFFILSKIALDLIKSFDWQPDVIHCQDGMMGLIPKWLKTSIKSDNFYNKIASVLTIHNLNHQPFIKLHELKQFGLKRKETKKLRKFLKKRDAVNVMAEAIDNADIINTVSPTYAKEILTKKYGAGLAKLLKANKPKFTGILNGFDYHDFDPRDNKDTPINYGIRNLDMKVKNKLYLQKKFNLTESPDLPLICAVTRLTPQKGLDLIDDVMKELVDMGAQFIILGAGAESIEKVFIKAEKKYPEAIAAEMKFDSNLAQTIYAGADMLLMPSRFEPCGLSQIIAMRFGAIPIVRETGGLADTVRDGYTGFVFKHYDKQAFLWAIRRAVDVYYNQKDYWHKMQIRAMKKDFSWKSSAKKYLWLYKKAIRNRNLYLKNQESEKEKHG